MQDFPLTVTGILRHGTTWYSGRKVITKTPTATAKSASVNSARVWPNSHTA